MEKASEEQQQETVTTVEARFLDLALKDDELLTKQGILEQEFRIGACQIEGEGEGGRGLGQQGSVEAVGFQLAEQAGRECGAVGEGHGK